MTNLWMPGGYLPVKRTMNHAPTIAKSAAIQMKKSTIQCGISSRPFTIGMNRLYSSCQSNSVTAT